MDELTIVYDSQEVRRSLLENQLVWLRQQTKLVETKLATLKKRGEPELPDLKSLLESDSDLLSLVPTPTTTTGPPTNSALTCNEWLFATDFQEWAFTLPDTVSQQDVWLAVKYLESSD